MSAALIAAGASILSGFMGQSAERAAIAAQNAYNDPQAMRDRAEAAGFNPLSFVGPGVGNQTTTGGSNYMGAAIADAGLAVAADLSRKQELTRLEALSAENKALADQVQRSLLTPSVGGVYARQQLVPTLGGALGQGNSTAGANAVAAAALGFRPLQDVNPMDPRRDVDNKPMTSTSGFMTIDNPYLPFPIYAPTLDGDEALQWYDYPSLIIPTAVGAGVAAYKSGVFDKNGPLFRGVNSFFQKAPPSPFAPYISNPNGYGYGRP